MITLTNKTGNASIPGYLVKSVRDGGFKYCGPGDTPVGVVIEKVPNGQPCKIQADGVAKVYVHKNVSRNTPLRSITADDGATPGSAVPIGSKSEYVLIGRTLEAGRGLLDVVINISPVIDASSGGSVTSVSAGNGMNFTTITGSGPVTLGTPDSITTSSTNSVGPTSHTHAITGFAILGGSPANTYLALFSSATTIYGTSSLAFASGTLTVNNKIKVSTIDEQIANVGVTIEGVLMRDLTVFVYNSTTLAGRMDATSVNFGLTSLNGRHINMTPVAGAHFNVGNTNNSGVFCTIKDTNSGSPGTSILRLQKATNTDVVFRVDESGPIYMAFLGSNDTEDHIVAINDSTGLLTKRSVSSVIAYGSTTQIPYVNAGGTAFLYSANLTFNGSTLAVGGAITATGEITAFA